MGSDNAPNKRSVSSRLRRALRWLVHPGDSLANRTLNAGVWAFALSLVTLLFRIVRAVVIARFLVPNDFGLMGIALLVLALVETFTKTGFDDALVQRKGDIQGHLDAAWTVSVIRGLLLGTVLAGILRTNAND